MKQKKKNWQWTKSKNHNSYHYSKYLRYLYHILYYNYYNLGIDKVHNNMCYVTPILIVQILLIATDA